MENTDKAVIVKDLYKTFKLPHEKHSGIKQAIVNVLRLKRGFESQQVLHGISFEIKKGEFFGIVGRNGSGKSTLLKLLAGIYAPDKGLVQLNGSLTPFIELGVGFNPELTGRENVFMNGALLGFDNKEMEAMYDDIVEFAELGKFMDQKLKNYSSGMQVRLAFAIAIRANSDILLLDEVLAVGDEAFQRKCYEYFARIKKEKRTVIFVSHDMDAVKNFCDRAILVEKGEIQAYGKSSEIAALYSQLNIEDDAQSHPGKGKKQWGNGDVTMKKVSVISDGKEKKSFYKNEPLEVRYEFTAHKDLKNVIFGIVVQNTQGHYVFASNTQMLDSKTYSLKAGQTYQATFDLGKNIYTNGSYTISGALTNLNRTTIYAKMEEIAQFTVGGWLMAHAAVHPEHTFSLKESEKKDRVPKK